MSWTRFFRRNQIDRERAEELASYLDHETERAIARGASPDEARNTARRKLGNTTRVREEIYGMNSFSPLETLIQDLRYAFRVLRKSPGFALVAVLSLMLGIGANTAVFSVIRAVMLRPLPYPEPGRLMRVGQPGDFDAIGLNQFEFWRDHGFMFSSTSAYGGPRDASLTYGTAQQWISAMPVSRDFLRTLGVAPAAGREFTVAETSRRGPRAIILSDGLWRSAFHGDRNVLGTTARLNSGTYTVVGILPPGFWFSPAADAFYPMQPTGSVGDGGTNTQMIARLKPGVSLAQARAQLPAIGEAFRREHPTFPKTFRFTLAIEPLQEYLAGNVRLNLLLLFGAVALLLLIACFNLAGIMLARLSARRKEIAMRLALGSGRARLFRQFFMENFLVTAAGGLAGLLGAAVLLKGAVAVIPFHLNAAGTIGVDGEVMAFSLGVALLTAFVMSTLPAGAANRLDIQESLKSGARDAGFGIRQRARGVLVVGQVALSVTMLVSAGLVIASLYRLYNENLGFRPAGLTTVATTFPADRAKTGPALWQIESEEFARLRALPGVRQVAAINVLPLSGWSNFPTERENHPESGIGGMEIRAVSPSYFDIMGIAVTRGRAFGEDDTSTAAPALIVSETVARRWWQTADPLGDRVVIGRLQGRDIGKRVPRAVVGVAADVKTSMKERPWPVVYIPLAQDADFTDAPTWIMRGTPGPGFAAELRRAILAVDPRQRIGEVRTMDAVVSSTTADTRFNAWLFGSLAGIALALTVIGIYGLLSFSVARRTSEIGTRIALGASRFAVLSLILRQGLGLILAGLVVGLAGAYGVTHFIQTLLFSVKPTDPASFVAVSVLLITAGLLASYLPARRATRIDPMRALREE